MEWFVILLALGVAIGPILYLMPSDRDRYLTSLRALARKLGYTVQVDKVLKLDPTDDERVTCRWRHAPSRGVLRALPTAPGHHTQ